MPTNFIKFPSIEKFSDVNAYVKRHYVLEERPITHYRGKIKLHGTNAAILVSRDGVVECGKRTGKINVQNDNAGFANYIETVKDLVPRIGRDIIIYGEWAGPGVQKRVAVSQIPAKTFFIFAVLDVESQMIAVEPALIKEWLGDDHPFEIIPWAANGFTFKIDFRLQSSMEEAMDGITQLVDHCDKIDPYIKERFGIEGIGEGYVFTPLVDQMPFNEYSNFIFKAKGKSHTVAAHETTNKIQIDPVVLNTYIDFAKNFVTESRCEQGLNESCDGVATTANIGKFMAWIGPDVKKESVNELEASGLEWKQVSKQVNALARDWFILRIEKSMFNN